MYQLSHINLFFGQQDIFTDASLTIRPGERVGLVGANGSGKTTLLKMFSGQMQPESGQVIIPPGHRVGYLPQEMAIFDRPHSLLDEMMTVFDDLRGMERDMRKLEHIIAVEHNARDLERYGHLQEEFSRQEGFTMEARAKEVLSGLGFNVQDQQRPVREFSGGWRMRIALARLLLQKPELLLLDEPTNHLDMETLIWLENFLQGYRGTIVLVSHDRYFLDKIITETAEITAFSIRQIPGNYSDYEIRKMKELEQLKATLKNQERKRAATEQFIERFRYKATKARQVQSRIKQLAKMEEISISNGGQNIQFNFPEGPRSGAVVASLKEVAFAYDTREIFRDVNLELTRGDRAALIGVNGAGKTTLMKVISGQLMPTCGTFRLGYGVQIAYFAQHQLEALNPGATILDEVWSEAPDIPQSRIRGMLGRFLFSDDDVFKPIQVLSGGEKSRVVLVKMLLKKANFLILDEPTNHLDMQSKEVLANALDSFSGTLLVVSHDRFFLDMLVTRIFAIEGDRCKEYPGNYSDYEDRLASRIAQDESQEKAKPAATDEKERKRREAEVRQMRSQLKKPLQLQFDTVDAEIKNLSRQCDAVTELMSGELFSAKTPAEMEQIGKQYNHLKSRLDDLEVKWLELTESIEEVEAMDADALQMSTKKK